jgi:uncharacterized protein YjbJ (UPF0337 family)
MSDVNRSDREHGEALADQVKGKVKETVGDLTGDDSTKYSGKADSLKGKAAEAWTDAKDKLDPDRTADER